MTSEMVSDEREYEFEFSGGDLALDFANTVSDRPAEVPNEHLVSYRDLVSWACQAGVVTAIEAERLAARAEADPGAARAVHARAVALREAVYRAFASVAAESAPAAADLAALNAALAGALAHARVVPSDGTFAWGWEDGPALDRVLWPVARAAADLLVSDRLSTVRECAAHDCNWLFLDTTKNHSRRWCDMKSCGNRAKAHRFYLRKKGGA